MGYSFGVLKPDCLERGLETQIFSILKLSGLEVITAKRKRLSILEAEFLYDRCRKNNFFLDLISFMTSGDVLLYVVTGDGETIESLNKTIGHTNPKLAESGTVRSLGESVCRNLSHSTASEHTFQREVSYFLTRQERESIGLAF